MDELIALLKQEKPNHDAMGEVCKRDHAAAVWLAQNLSFPLREGTENEKVVYNFLTRTNRLLFRSISDNIPVKKGATIVEIGFGTADCLRQVAAKLSAAGGGVIVGLEISPDCVRLARERQEEYEGVEIRYELVEPDAPLPLPTSSVDVFYHSNCWYFWKDLSSTLEEIKRVLRSGGQHLVCSRVCSVKRLFGTLMDKVSAIFRHTDLDVFKLAMEGVGFTHLSTQRISLGDSGLHYNYTTCIVEKEKEKEEERGEGEKM
uniref:Methyltransferase type 11 domain-containing protein n=1 Tax=Palpitomonas bilix TaxID=652834 RepID=A0A7S3G697_9EUKA|mmetsp:Transcript_29318/g.75580  ORF Transcript_29318/g.75580 Transcript_29318/m.75580 type:complete len:260 (+) Transcript_29318:132-911(+)|eukprot:CAMPEP_0113884400 /NCGR_PEP_ID=MMETSP0780_2-20120614/10243_1 /TAXON_ID=652834 /ORGANISM="Palpitomonas bilix" /LENGTH=259 /DNA_ID=CAMNT_0000872029 /DNA_START=119 /DNA_END=898 /DNA_ORIENTATION=- /assembly_acc=CAM_ASM_000599